MTAKEFILQKSKEFSIPKKKILKTKDIGRKGHLIHVIEARTFMKQYDTERKVFVIERIKLIEEVGKVVEKKKIGSIQYRFGYYIIGKIGNREGKWTWGQFCPIIPDKDFWKLIELAKKEKTFL